MSVLEKVLQMRRQREETAEAAFRRIVDQLAEGRKAPSPEDVDAALVETGRTVEDLEAAVKRATRRNQLRAQIDRAEKLEASRGGIQKKIEEANRVLEAAEAQHARAVAPLRNQLEEIKQGTQQAANARHELQESMAEEDRAALDEAQREIDRTARERDAAKKHLAEMQTRRPGRDADDRDDWRSTSDGQIVDQSEVTAWQESVKRAEQRLRDAQKAADDAVARQDELLAKAMAS